MRLTSAKELANAKDTLYASVSEGKCTTATLRKMLPLIIREEGWNLSTMSIFLGVEIIYCDLCGKPSFAKKTISAYHGAYWACEDCAPKFGICKPCGTNVLELDLFNPSHVHADFQLPGTLYFPDLETQIAVYNADIMAGSAKGTKGFFRTLHEMKMIMTAANFTKKASDPCRYFGVELEVEKIPGAPPDLAERTLKSLGANFSMLKHDGSISRHGKNGFEIVTMPGTMAYHLSGTWNDFFENLADFFEEAPSTTGLHVHVGLATILPATLGKMLLFINSQKNREFVCDIARRQLDIANPNGRVYAGVKDDWRASDVIKLKQHRPECPWNPSNHLANNRYTMLANGVIKYDAWGNPIIKSIRPTAVSVRAACKCAPGAYSFGKYEALNLSTKRPTVEFRIFRGIVRQSFLYAALEFVDATVNYCTDASMSKLDYQSFLDWICDGRRKTYRHLFRHLVNLGWIDPPKQSELEVTAAPYGIT
jgi:hypothetical protein